MFPLSNKPYIWKWLCNSITVVTAKSRLSSDLSLARKKKVRFANSRNTITFTAYHWPKTMHRRAKEQVVPGIELGLPESESDVLTITLYNLMDAETTKTC